MSIDPLGHGFILLSPQRFQEFLDVLLPGSVLAAPMIALDGLSSRKSPADELTIEGPWPTSF